MEPFGVVGADVDAPVGDVFNALGSHRPGCRVDENAGVGHLGGKLHVGAVSVGRVDGESVGGGVHDDGGVLVANDVGPVRGGVFAGSHGDRHGFEHFLATLDGHGLGVVVGNSNNFVADGEVGVVVFFTVDSAAEVNTVDVHLDVDFGAGFPEVFGPPPDFAVVEPEELALNFGFGFDGDGVLRSLTVFDVGVEFDPDCLTDTNRGFGKRRKGRGGGVGRVDGAEAHFLLLLTLGLNGQGVGTAVAQRFGGFPLLFVFVQRCFDDFAVFVGHGDCAEFTIPDLDGDGFGGVDVLLPVFDVGFRFFVFGAFRRLGCRIDSFVAAVLTSGAST